MSEDKKLICEADDFMERHLEAIENAMLKKRLEEAYAKIDLQQMLTTPFPHSGEWIREINADGTLKLSYPPQPKTHVQRKD